MKRTEQKTVLEAFRKVMGRERTTLTGHSGNASGSFQDRK